MVKKTKAELQAEIENLKQVLENSIPKFVSPNGGSLEEIQQEHAAIYQLLLDLIDSLGNKAW